jgi:hypothetical protein
VSTETGRTAAVIFAVGLLTAVLWSGGYQAAFGPAALIVGGWLIGMATGIERGQRDAAARRE